MGVKRKLPRTRRPRRRSEPAAETIAVRAVRGAEPACSRKRAAQTPAVDLADAPTSPTGSPAKPKAARTRKTAPVTRVAASQNPAAPAAQADSRTLQTNRANASAATPQGHAQQKNAPPHTGGTRSRKTRRKPALAHAKFAVGEVVRHRLYPFRGIIFDIDPVFANTEEWWLAIPENVRPRKDQPFYHLLAENAETEYIAYVSEQNLLRDTSGMPVRHPQVQEYFVEDEDGRYRPVYLEMLN